jgi:hypothetical protein
MSALKRFFCSVVRLAFEILQRHLNRQIAPRRTDCTRGDHSSSLPLFGAIDPSPIAGTSAKPAVAGELTGLHKVPILRAIRKGKISAEKDEHGGWRVQPAELFRLYRPLPEQRNGNKSPTAFERER